MGAGEGLSGLRGGFGERPNQKLCTVCVRKRIQRSEGLSFCGCE